MTIAAALLSGLVFLASLSMFVEVARGWRRIGQLRDQPAELEDAPAVSVLFSALNEEKDIEQALRSMLAMDYPNLEVVAIDDRSSDSTGAILDRLAEEFERSAPGRLKVLHIRDLPPGWLGKCHALHRGSELASGTYLLFTDADAVFSPTALRRAIGYCRREKIDHLAVYAQLAVHGPLLAMWMLSQRGGFMAQAKPWLVRTSKDHFVGQGTFNLVRAEAFREAGGFEALRLAVFEDLMLGVIMKMKGFEADVLFGDDMLWAEWYGSTVDMIHGLEKNTFAAFDYSVKGLALSSALMLVMRVWPWVGLAATSGVAWWLNLATVLVEALFYLDMNRSTRWTPLALVFLPVISLMSVVVWWYASMKTLWRGGVEWRGTLYSLEQLRKGA